MNAHILVFDSGVGALSITEPIRKRLSGSQVTLLADNAQQPYGLLAEEALTERVIALLTKVCRNYHPDIIVIGCNSASTIALPALRAALTIPIVGVVPAIKPAGLHSDSKVIGVLGTPGTVQRVYTQQLIDDFAAHCEVIAVGSNELVTAVEQTMRGVESDAAFFTSVMQPFTRHPLRVALDTIVLACTHFPLVQRQLAIAAPNIVYWIDSAEAIARRVEYLLTHHHTPTGRTSMRCGNVALFTDPSTVNAVLVSHLQQRGFEQVMGWPAEGRPTILPAQE